MKAHMAAAAAQVEHAGAGLRGGDGRHLAQVLALSVDGAVQVGGGLRAELPVDGIIMGAGGHGTSLRGEWGQALR